MSVLSSGYLRPAIASVLLMMESYHSRFAPPERIAAIASVAMSLAIVFLSSGLSMLNSGRPDFLRSSCKNWTTSGNPPIRSDSNCSVPALPVWWIKDVEANSSGVSPISSITSLIIFSYLGCMLGFKSPLVVFLRAAFSSAVASLLPFNSPRSTLPKISSAVWKPAPVMAFLNASKNWFKRFNIAATIPAGLPLASKSPKASAIASSINSSLSAASDITARAGLSGLALFHSAGAV